MSIRDAALGSMPDGPSRDVATIAAAVKAVDAARVACDAARAALLALLPDSAAAAPTAADTGCQHPIGARREVRTFSGSDWLCDACGEALP